MLCLLGPYGDFFIDVLAEILEKFPDVDAFSFDGLHYGGVCYCRHCRENYRNDARAEIPPTDMNDPAFRRYQHWADRRMEDLVRRMQTRLKGIKPDVALVTWTTNAGRFGHFLSIPRNMPARMNLLLDAPDQEFWLDETNRGTTIVPAFANAYIWATTNHRVAFSEPYLLSHGNPYGKDSFPPHEIQRRMMLALTYGAAPSIAVIQPPNLQEELYACLDEVQRRKPWLTDKSPEPWGAMLMSDNTRNFYGRSAGRVEERYMAAVLGTFRTAVEEHLPVTVINDWNLNADDLARYKVLILPNAACLDDVQIAAVEKFVSTGGGLVASLDTSLFDEYGNPREKFALADVLGVDYRGLPRRAPRRKAEEIDVNFAQAIGPDYWEKRKNIFDFRQDAASFLNQGRMQTYVGDNPVTFKGPAVRVATKGSDAKILGTIRTKSVAGAPLMPGRRGASHTARDTSSISRPVSTRPIISTPIPTSGWPSNMPSPGRPRPRSRSSSKRRCASMRPSCDRAEGGAGDGAAGRPPLQRPQHDAPSRLPNDDVPLREEVVPIHDIHVTFAPGYRVARIHLEPEGRDLEPVKTPQGVRVTVPRLDVHAMVVAELDPAAKP